jgi:signal peptidase II
MRSNTWQAVSLSLILGGAIGNLIDRFRFHYVTDFFDFHLGAWHFATFNVADSAISIGAILLMVRLIFFDKAS